MCRSRSDITSPGWKRFVRSFVDAVKDLSNQQANKRFRNDAHTITELILHCGEAEWWWIQCVVNGKDVDDELRNSKPFWDVLEEEKSVEMSADKAIEIIDEISHMSRELFASFSDEDLDRVYEKELPTRTIKHSHCEWILHHVSSMAKIMMAQHKGQIFMLKRMSGGMSSRFKVRCSRLKQLPDSQRDLKPRIYADYYGLNKKIKPRLKAWGVQFSTQSIKEFNRNRSAGILPA